MNTRSLRFRLLYWYTMWLAVVFLATGAIVYFTLANYLENNLVQLQQRRADRLARLLAQPLPAGPGLADEIRTDFAPEASSRFIRIFRPDGKIIYQSGRPNDQSFDPAQIPPPSAQPGLHWFKPAASPQLVLLTVPAGPVGGPIYLVETGESFGPVQQELHRLLFLLAICAVGLAAGALAGGLLLVRRALRPVGEITRRAEGITSRNLTERLPVPATGDELEQLTLALNRMISRLDEAFQHNRRFLADASHELRTPLTVLRSELESLVRASETQTSGRENLGSLLEEVERLAHLVENLFALSRLDAGLAQSKPQVFDLAHLAFATAEQLCLLAEDKFLTITSQAGTPVYVDGDRARIKQVIVNLLDNAIKYTPEYGAVKLTVFARGQEAVCEVSDNGMGIPAEALPLVFDRFYRVDAARCRDQGGAGIGLSIVKAICLAHGGRVEAESIPGAGSTFRVFLPLAKKPPTAAAVEPA